MLGLQVGCPRIVYGTSCVRRHRRHAGCHAHLRLRSSPRRPSLKNGGVHFLPSRELMGQGGRGRSMIGEGSRFIWDFRTTRRCMGAAYQDIPALDFLLRFEHDFPRFRSARIPSAYVVSAYLSYTRPHILRVFCHRGWSESARFRVRHASLMPAPAHSHRPFDGCSLTRIVGRPSAFPSTRHPTLC